MSQKLLANLALAGIGLTIVLIAIMGIMSSGAH